MRKRRAKNSYQSSKGETVPTEDTAKFNDVLFKIDKHLSPREAFNFQLVEVILSIFYFVLCSRRIKKIAIYKIIYTVFM